MFPTKRAIRHLTIDLEDLTLDLTPGLRLTVKVVMNDGTSATLLSEYVPTDVEPFVAPAVDTLVEAWMFGEGAKQVVAWCQGRDRAAQSRRVRTDLLGS